MASTIAIRWSGWSPPSTARESIGQALLYTRAAPYEKIRRHAGALVQLRDRGDAARHLEPVLGPAPARRRARRRAHRVSALGRRPRRRTYPHLPLPRAALPA